MRITSWLRAAAALVTLASPSIAQVSNAFKRPDVKADLIVGGHASSEARTIWLGVRVKLGPGWKTYWRSPGDSGLPSEFDWAGSRNIEHAEVRWPAPHRIEVQGVETIGYTGEIVFPVEVRVKNSDTPSKISLNLGLYACSTICVRDDHAFVAAIAPNERHPDQQALIEAWRARVPKTSSEALSVTSIRLVAASPPVLQVDAKAAQPFGAPDLFLESEPPVFGSKPQVAPGPDGTATFTVALEDETVESLKGRAFRITLVDGERAVEASSADVTSGPSALAGGSPQANEQRLWTPLGIALVGGFILNLMPCVFPVLSLKLLAFVNQEVRRKRQIRAGFGASAAGIVASFLVLASAMVALKMAGATVGWGIQFQQPIFLAVMAAVLTLFAANLLGLFEIVLPGRLTDGLDRAGRGTSLASHFGSGFVATLLATPCSAPFVGTAVGFALANGAKEIYLVFAMLGLGMAAPYLLVAAVPRLATILPRPGRWMLVIKQVMGLGLLATAAWLLTVVATIAGTLTAFGSAALLGVFIAGLWAQQRASGMLKTILLLATIGIPGATMAAVSVFGGPAAPKEGIPWRAFDPQEVSVLVGEGRSVLVDITAVWCITCKVNKVLILSDADVAARLKTDVASVQGDWTKPDPRISAYLASFGRYGIPFNVVYGPDAPNGIVLPELLTKAAVLEAFDKAAGRSSARTPAH